MTTQSGELIMAASRIQLLLFLSSVMLVRGDELRFLALGDWGGIQLWPYTTLYERAVSKGMGKVAENLGTQFTVALGKNEGRMLLLFLYSYWQPGSVFKKLHTG